MESLKAFALEKMIVRKDHVLCTRCCKSEPIHPGDGTPAVSFIWALERMAERHRKCEPVGVHRS